MKTVLRYRCCRLLLAAVVGVVAGGQSLAKPTAFDTAQTVDKLLAEELFQDADKAKLAPRVSDAIYLRRVWLDLVGDIPSPEHVTSFLLDPATNKRERVVDELLDNPQYGQNWARYWRDVILSRRLEDRAALVSNPLVVTLTEKLNENERWDKIAVEFITAKGDVRENGATAIQMAQDGRTEETTAEVSRIFLGIQIQCAQCHDHKTDRWTREQFHELAAFFPRIAVRPVQSPIKRSFEVVANDRPEPRRPQKPNPDARRGEPEHYMPNLDDPAAIGTRMQPKFFLTSAELQFGVTDDERRGKVADWITDNAWFATAYVNRVWGELVGEGFYEPIDDMGPDRKPTAPQTVEYLSKQFAKSGYDPKWLFQVICATEAYQRESRPRRSIDEIAFTANVAQPLRSDQLFNALLTAVDTPEMEQSYNRRGRPRPGEMAAMGPYGRPPSVRQAFEVAFGYDPSDPRDSVTSSIPQALALMNGVRLNLAIRAIRQDTLLGRLLADIDDNHDLVQELYLRTLSREPTEKEFRMAMDFCSSSKNRSAVFEDLFWALVNSSEFSHRR